MAELQPRPIKRLLVANRGEIATRILSSARELRLETFATYTENDFSHTHNASHALLLPSPASYLDIPLIVSLAKNHNIDAVHPGYGFLSESAPFAAAMAEAGVMVVGPGAEALERTGDKLAAKRLAESCGVPILPALSEPTSEVAAVRAFAEQNGLPVMIKATDGGGGRGIRLVRRLSDLEAAFARAVEESPGKSVFAEKAVVDGWRHVEVQVLGDGRGRVRHLWERECSVQRRFQKVVEVAPMTNRGRGVGEVIEAAVRMGEKIRYRSLGTFEFLLNPASGEFYFLEINPRLQVEHTITESICSIDIVKTQLQLAQGTAFEQTALANIPTTDPLAPPPPLRSIQLRITAEDPEKNWSLSIGKISSFHFPSGNGVRVDTALVRSAPAIVSADFDSVIAKIIVTASSWEDVIAKAQRALEDTRIEGVKTNIPVLRAIVAHPDFSAGACDTQWLESHHSELLSQSLAFSDTARHNPFHGLLKQSSQSSSSSSAIALASSSSSIPLFRKDDAWTLTLTPTGSQVKQTHHLKLTRIQRNDFPTSLSASLTFTPASGQPQAYTLDLNATSASASALNAAHHKRGSASDPSHVIVPFSGKLVEVLVDEGDVVAKDEVICVVRQMKMELEVRSHRAGVVGYVTEAEDGEEVSEGLLAAVVLGEGEVRAKL